VKKKEAIGVFTERYRSVCVPFLPVTVRLFRIKK